MFFRFPTIAVFVCLAILCVLAGGGCSGESGASSDDSDNAVAQNPPARPVPRRDQSRPVAPPQQPPERPFETPPQPVEPPVKPRRTLADLFDGPQQVERLPIDEAKVTSAGIRKLAGKHLVLYTDLAADKEIDGLPHVFDQAVPQWAAYFELDAERVADWRVTGFLMGKKETFARAGLLPDFLPDFNHGFTHGMEIWAYEQDEAYYRRHLLLHEGTHSFMQLLLGGAGPPWYAEGMAELLATHRWRDGRLTLNYMPPDKTETPGWGRIKIIQDRYAEGAGLPLDRIMAYGARAHLEVDPYGWCWGAAAFFDGHPLYRPAFAKLRSHVRSAPGIFNRALKDELAAAWPQLAEEWQLFVVEADYGYDFARTAVQHKSSAPLPAAGASVSVAADRGWQSSGLQVEAGRAYQIAAVGRYQIGDKPKVWWCEPGGVTIEYYRGQPLGMLTLAVRDDSAPPTGLTPLAAPQPVGLGGTTTFQRSGVLYFRINESPAALADNQGELTVNIKPGDGS